MKIAFRETQGMKVYKDNPVDFTHGKTYDVPKKQGEYLLATHPDNFCTPDDLGKLVAEESKLAAVREEELKNSVPSGHPTNDIGDTQGAILNELSVEHREAYKRASQAIDMGKTRADLTALEREAFDLVEGPPEEETPKTETGTGAGNGNGGNS